MLARFASVLSVLPVVMTAHDCVASLHTVERDASRDTLRGIQPRDVVLVNRAAVYYDELRVGDVVLVRRARSSAPLSGGAQSRSWMQSQPEAVCNTQPALTARVCYAAARAPDAVEEARLVRLRALPGEFIPGGGPGRVPAGRAWVVAGHAEDGDSAARDSAHGWGVLPLALVIGRVSHVVWPLEHARHVPRSR